MRAVGEKDIIMIGNKFCNRGVGDAIECGQGYSLTFRACIGGPADGAGMKGTPGLLRTMEMSWRCRCQCIPTAEVCRQSPGHHEPHIRLWMSLDVDSRGNGSGRC